MMTANQKKLSEKYGTPEQFENAIWSAYTDLFITSREADFAVKKYRDKWNEAGTSKQQGERK